MSAAEELVKDLRAKGVMLEVRNLNIAFEAPDGAMTQGDLDTMRGLKPEIQLVLERNCKPHNDQRNYLDIRQDNGWIKTTCIVCGRWVGRRPLGVGADPDC